MKTCAAEGCNEKFDPKKGRKGRKYCSFACGQTDRNRISFRDNPKLWMFRSIKQHAERKGLQFEMTVDDIPDTPERCPVFPWLRLKRPTGLGRKFYPNAPSIDRIDPKVGYLPENLRIISWRANSLRSNGTIREMEHVLLDLRRIEEKLKKKSN